MLTSLAEAQTRRKPSLPVKLSTWRAPLVFAVCLVAGLGVVAWRTNGRTKGARAVASAQAQACGASLELQLSQASTAAEVLGALVRQSRAGLTNFQRIASELLTSRPGLASLELQPGGVVSEVVPRAGHERAVGFNVLKDPGQRFGANEAIARRGLTVSGPVTVDRGEPGIVARVPVFQRTADGRDAFWGFVAVSMRLGDALARAQVDNLVRQGYDFAFFAPGSSSQQGVTIASHGLSSLADTVQQSIRAQNLELRLALKPRHGWINIPKILIESMAVLLVSALVSLSVNLFESQSAIAADLKEAGQRLAREQTDRTQAQAECRETEERLTAAQAELKQTQSALQLAQSKAAEVQARLDSGVSASDEGAQARQEELREAHAARQKAQNTVAELQTRLDGAALAGKAAATAAQVRFQQGQAAVADLQVRLEAATRLTRETTAASAAKVAQLEESNRELLARLQVAEQAQARVAELSELFQKAQEELRQKQKTSTESEGMASGLAVEAEPSENLEKDSRRKSEVEPAEPVARKPVKAAKREKATRDDQLHLFGGAASPVSGPEQPPTETGARAKLPPTPAADPAQLRKAVGQILPLLMERDPGAKDCLKDNRTVFRSAFTPEAYVEFEKLFSTGGFDIALEQLKKAARKHGINV